PQGQRLGVLSLRRKSLVFSSRLNESSRRPLPSLTPLLRRSRKGCSSRRYLQCSLFQRVVISSPSGSTTVWLTVVALLQSRAQLERQRRRRRLSLAGNRWGYRRLTCSCGVHSRRLPQES